MEGFIDGKIYYKMGNEYYVRNSSAPSKKKIKKDPAYKTVRENYAKFGKASSISSCFKKSLGSAIDIVSDTRLSNRITSLFSHVIHYGHSDTKKETIEILANKELFAGFQFKEDRNFDQIFKTEHHLSCKKSRKEIVLDIPSFAIGKGIVKVNGATHYRMMVCVVCFSDYVFNQKKYIPIDSSLNKFFVSSYSDLILMKGKSEPLSLKTKISIKTVIPDSVGMITCLGVEFYQKSGELFYPLERMSCMKIGGVF